VHSFCTGQNATKCPAGTQHNHTADRKEIGKNQNSKITFEIAVFTYFFILYFYIMRALKCDSFEKKKKVAK